MKNLEKVLEKLYNTLGNSYLTENFETGPFEFKVKIRKGTGGDLKDYIVEVYSFPDVPSTFKYKLKSPYHGIHLSTLQHKFKDYIEYVDSSFGGFGKTISVKFMNVKGKY